MPLNLSSVFKTTDSVLNNLLSKYSRARFVGYNQADNNKRYYLTSLVTKGFFYKARKQPITGEVVERLRIVPENSTVSDAIKAGSMVELSDSVGNFTRFKIKVIREPNPPNYEWYLELIPNLEDKSTIT